MRRGIGLIVWGAAWGAVSASTARAELLAGVGEGVPAVRARHVVFVADGRGPKWQETLELSGVRGRFVRFVAVPAPPRFPPPLVDLGPKLAEATAMQRPRWLGIREDPFGPSIVSRWTRPPEPDEPPAPAPPAPAPLVSVSRASFRGEVPTSTLTKRPELPPSLAGFVGRFRVEMSPSVTAAVARYMNRGWTVVGMVYEPERPADRHRLGPLRIELDRGEPLYPMAQIDPDPATELFVIAPSAYRTRVVPFRWSETPWSPEVSPPGRALGLGHAVWDVDDRGVPPWIAGAFTDNRDADEITHIRHHPADELYRDLELEPSGPVPARPRRGSNLDLWLGILFGAVPVFAAPESWIAWLVQRRARARATPKRVGWATRIWFLWPAIVGVHWLTTMEGAGQWAALSPFAIALIALRPFEPEERRFVRARFEKKRKKR